MTQVTAGQLIGRAPWLVEGLKRIPLDFMGGGRNFYLIRRKSHKPSPLLKAFIGIVKMNVSKGGQD